MDELRSKLKELIERLRDRDERAYVTTVAGAGDYYCGFENAEECIADELEEILAETNSGVSPA